MQVQAVLADASQMLQNHLQWVTDGLSNLALLRQQMQNHSQGTALPGYAYPAMGSSTPGMRSTALPGNGSGGTLPTPTNSMGFGQHLTATPGMGGGMQPSATLAAHPAQNPTATPGMGGGMPPNTTPGAGSGQSPTRTRAMGGDGRH